MIRRITVNPGSSTDHLRGVYGFRFLQIPTGSTFQLDSSAEAIACAAYESVVLPFGPNQPFSVQFTAPANNVNPWQPGALVVEIGTAPSDAQFLLGPVVPLGAPIQIAPNQVNSPPANGPAFANQSFSALTGSYEGAAAIAALDLTAQASGDINGGGSAQYRRLSCLTPNNFNPSNTPTDYALMATRPRLVKLATVTSLVGNVGNGNHFIDPASGNIGTGPGGSVHILDAKAIAGLVMTVSFGSFTGGSSPTFSVGIIGYTDADDVNGQICLNTQTAAISAGGGAYTAVGERVGSYQVAINANGYGISIIPVRVPALLGFYNIAGGPTALNNVRIVFYAVPA